jgi:hypothetical protein
MARTLLVPVLSVCAVGLAAASLVGPSLVAVPPGAPMIVAAGDTPALLPARLDGADCATLAAPAAAEKGSPEAGTPGRLVALTLQPGPHGLTAALRELPAHAAGVDGTLIVVLDPQGRFLALLHSPGSAKATADEDAPVSCEDLAQEIETIGSI